jgi:hypothetical protein
LRDISAAQLSGVVSYVGTLALNLIAAFVMFLGVAYFPIPALLLLADLFVVAKRQLFRRLPWPHLTMMFAATALLTWAVHST